MNRVNLILGSALLKELRTSPRNKHRRYDWCRAGARGKFLGPPSRGPGLVTASTTDRTKPDYGRRACARSWLGN